MKPLDERATAVVRAWTRLYTGRLLPEVRDARRAEIDSDLWEHSHAAGKTTGDRRSVAGQMLARSLLGVAADLSWRSKMAHGPGRLVKEGIPMNDRIKWNWWIPAPIVLICLGALMVLTHIVGDGVESPWSRTAAGWNPSLFDRVGAVAALGFFFLVLPIWALTVRRGHPGWTVVMLVPCFLISLTPAGWSDAGWILILPVLGIVTLVGAVVNLAQRSLEEGTSPSPARARPTHS